MVSGGKHNLVYHITYYSTMVDGSNTYQINASKYLVPMHVLTFVV